MDITVAIERRTGPHEKAYWQQYHVALEVGMSVLNVLDVISRSQDPTLAYEASCRRGLCSVCLLNINGKVVKSCMQLADVDLTIQTGSKNPVKDLACSNRRIEKEGD